jgi:hypothetical protein
MRFDAYLASCKEVAATAADGCNEGVSNPETRD